MSDPLWFSDAGETRIATLLAQTTRGMKRADDQDVLCGSSHIVKSNDDGRINSQYKALTPA